MIRRSGILCNFDGYDVYTVYCRWESCTKHPSKPHAAAQSGQAELWDLKLEVGHSSQQLPIGRQIMRNKGYPMTPDFTPRRSPSSIQHSWPFKCEISPKFSELPREVQHLLVHGIIALVPGRLISNRPFESKFQRQISTFVVQISSHCFRN